MTLTLHQPAPMEEPGPIFIVDDNNDDRFFMGHEIKALFGETPVRFFRTGMSLIDYFYEIRRLGHASRPNEIPRLILMDLYMPGMDGLLALKILRKTLSLEIPVVIISGTKDIAEINKAYAHGANVFLSKPFSRAEFIQALHRDANLSQINQA